MADKKGDKVFDVAKPGSAKPDTGSKPMVVGHKTITTDPTLAKEADDKSEEKPEETEKDEEQKLAVSTKIIITPPSEEKPEETDDKPQKEAKKPEETEKTEPESDSSEISSEEKSEEDPTKNKEKTVGEEQVAREERLDEMVKSKEYNVPIKESSSSAVKTFITTFLVVGVIGLIAVVLLVDAEILDLGIELPFDLL